MHGWRFCGSGLLAEGLVSGPAWSLMPAGAVLESSTFRFGSRTEALGFGELTKRFDGHLRAVDLKGAVYEYPFGNLR
jgi:hypothetical protein